MKYLLLSFVLFSLLHKSFAGNINVRKDDSVFVTARITLAKCKNTVIKERKLIDSDVHYVLISFTNHSDKKIYIPNTIRMLLADDSLRAVLVERNGAPHGYFYDEFFRYLRYDFKLVWDEEFDPNSNPSPFMTCIKFETPQMKMHYKNHKVGERYLKKHKGLPRSIKLSYSLYLSSHETQKYAFIADVSSIFNTPGNYKIYYQPMLDSSSADKYPDEVNGYKKFVPSEISSNVIYIDVIK